MAKLMPPMLSAVSRTMGCTKRPSDMRMPMVIINTDAAASTISHSCRCFIVSCIMFCSLLCAMQAAFI